MDIITNVLSRLWNEIKVDLKDILRTQLLVVATISVVLSAFLPIWILGVLLVVAWGWLVKSHFDDSIEDDETVKYEKFVPPESKPLDDVEPVQEDTKDKK